LVFVVILLPESSLIVSTVCVKVLSVLLTFLSPVLAILSKISSLVADCVDVVPPVVLKTVLVPTAVEEVTFDFVPDVALLLKSPLAIMV